ncbi:adenosylcobinamide amidohydrolase [Rhodoblastus acidophilus]|nr:adenosylcobinamide amidohydrolase [Rhodoblastus acidophilus]MCW2285183.1 adenosylcobinamide amidohydrolase [Rhodoblastus acidophilus]
MCDANAMGATMEAAPFAFSCAPPFLTARFSAPRRTLGWSMLHPGFSIVRDIVWVEVRDRDLPPEVDACAFLRAKLASIGLPQALAFMTARDIRRHHFRQSRVEDVEAACLTTVGLSNGERVGARKPFRALVGTINTLIHVSRPLTDGAFVEAISIAAQARTAAIVETWRPPAGPAITGTGTDCIVVAAPCGGEPMACAGLHTAVGEAIGGAVYAATREGVEAWALDMARARGASTV